MLTREEILRCPIVSYFETSFFVMPFLFEPGFLETDLEEIWTNFAVQEYPTYSYTSRVIIIRAVIIDLL